ncbi:TetR/AcrR family transcriptional regulator [Enterovirga rhinocerotis]|uniref:TetR family transcriptional regulator n=1 Tax=Enterovirga rhinocerotis TaxID=1339210 RepID=A0A4R7BMJ7_9HYPH|nr:TetR/AcrR family transcriptional regulator [Enterovirga rhinocerotis]TDR85515.1 TetR family transcriptional regulator [Enterovirga rhinocerotis]
MRSGTKRPSGRGTPSASDLEQPSPPRKLKRHEKAERNRRAIVDAAAEVIGEHGYADASISRIMERAGLGHGTFYAYFESRADLFDKLLPLKGLEVLDLMRDQVAGSRDIIDLEVRGFAAFLRFVADHPWFFRLLHEGEIAAPRAYREHLDNILARFTRALKRSWDRGELPAYEEAELKTLAYVLIAARDYVYSNYINRSDDPEAAMREAVETYRKLLTCGLCGTAQTPA